jgi:hypothetical protein
LDSAGTGYVYANDDPVNLVDPSGKIAGDCGLSDIFVTNWPFGPGQVRITLSLVSAQGNIDWWGGTLFITGMGTTRALPLGRPPGVNNSIVTASFNGYPLGFGAYTFTFLGLAGLVNGGTCAIVASSFVVNLP